MEMRELRETGGRGGKGGVRKEVAFFSLGLGQGCQPSRSMEKRDGGAPGGTRELPEIFLEALLPSRCH